MKIPFSTKKQTKLPDGLADLGDDSLAEDLSGEDQFIEGLTDLYIPEENTQAHVRDVADVLLDAGKINQKLYAKLRRQQATCPEKDVETLLLDDELCSSEDVLISKAELCGLKFQNIDTRKVDQTVFEKLDIEFIKSNSLCPVSIEQDILTIATSEPANVLAFEDVKRRTGMELQIVVCPQQDIDSICEAFTDEGIDDNLDDIINDMEDVEIVQDQEDETEDLEQMAGQSPVIKFVNYLISNALHEGASDIHIEPREKHTRIRYRIDGTLFETKQSPARMHPAIVSRIKIMSNLDISERRLPQDGKIAVIVGGSAIDLRVSILPTSHGEKVVVRVLDSKSVIRGLDSLGMESDVTKAFSEQISMPHGILLVTGPTGSGKSTTLYSGLCQLDGDKLNISTVEDPVEYELDFCNQVHVKDKIGLTFAGALRSLLRQDPDVIMVGEIRDNETARIAVQAALTGHLVLSTLHTNDAASSITRLVNIGIEPYLIAASLNGVLAQRLVRKICPNCKEPYKAPKNMKKYIDAAGIDKAKLFKGKGCDQCRDSGYQGRVGIYELLIVDDAFRNMINKDSSVANMRQAFLKTGQTTLFDDGMQKVKQGLTTIAEVLRVTEVYGKTQDEAFVENVT
ncbi:MAG: type II secretion system ATPase GspE [Planctomycetota bacterium]|jgi:type IV pilus assembly protein PilB